MKPLPVADAFRAILRTTHPDRVDLQQIDSNRWFQDRPRVMINGVLFHDLPDAPAFDAYDLLKASVKSQKIRIRGMLVLESAHAQIEDIDPIYAREGELDVFAGTLKIYEGKATSRSARTYTGVHCYADDLPLLKGSRGLDQSAFSEMLTLYAGHVAGQNAALAARSAQEVAKAGVNAPQRVDAVGKWITGEMGEADAAPIRATIVTDAHLRFYEKLMQKIGSQGTASFSQSHRAAPDTNPIPGYENMTFEQRRLAQDQYAARRR
jgi:hypothetical protein